MSDQLCTARGAVGTEQGKGNTREKGLTHVGIPRDVPAGVEEAVWGSDGRGENHDQLLLSSLAQGKTS